MDRTEATSYFALRRCPESEHSGWWAAARLRPEKPPAITALLAGRIRVEVSRWDAGEALTWAEGVDGWLAHELKPFLVYPHDPRLVDAAARNGASP
jgi:hypothetical protein